MLASSKRIAKRVAHEWVVQQITRSAAAIAYYAIFALAPTLVFATAVAAQFLTREDARSLAEHRLAVTLGARAAELAEEVLNSADFTRHGVYVTTVSAALLIYGASSVFVEMRSTLNRIFGHAASTAREAVRGAVLGRLLSGAFVVVGGVVFLASMLSSVLLHTIADYLPFAAQLGDGLWVFISPTLSFIVVLLVLAAVFTLLPSRRPPVRYIAVGVLASAVLFELGKWIFSYYIARSLIASAYGPSSSLVAFLVWIYYSVQIILLGAVLSQAMHAEASAAREPPLSVGNT